MISCGNSNPSAATRTRRHVALANLFFQLLVTFATVNIGAIAYVLSYSLKLLKLVFSERDALSYFTLYRAVKFNASGRNCSEACCGFGATPAKMQAVVSVLDKNICSYRRSAVIGDPNLKETLTRKWYLIQQQPLLNRIFKEPPIISYRKGRSLIDILVRAKI